jgi:hypothetical protein
MSNAAVVALCHGQTIRERERELLYLRYTRHIRYVVLNPFDRRPSNPFALHCTAQDFLTALLSTAQFCSVLICTIPAAIL